MSEEKTLLPGPPKIYAAIAGVINDIGVVSKDRINKQQGFKYRSVDDVYSVLNPALAKNKVFILPEIMDEKREVGTSRNGAKVTSVILKMKYTVYAEDGSYIQTILKGEAMDTGDKAINKAMAIAYKYLCFQLFCIPVEDMPDPDAESHDLEAEKQTTKTAGKHKASEGKTKASGERAAAKKPTEKNPTDEALRKQAEEYMSEKGKEALAGGKITEAMVNTIRSEQKRTGVADKAILVRLHTKAKKIEDLTVEEFNQAMKIFQVTKDMKQEAADEHK